MRHLARHATEAGRVYFTGGVTALLLKWRLSTIDIDLKMVPEQDALFRALPVLKESLEINVELASPDDFIPAVPGWEARSPLIVTHGLLSFHHFDLYSQALSKIERGHDRDMKDVSSMLELGFIERSSTLDYFNQIEGFLYRYPAIDPKGFRRAVERAVANA